MNQEYLPGTFRKDTFIIFILLAFVFAYFYQDGEWNANSRFGLIFSAVQEKSLSIDHFYNQEGTVTGDLSYFNGHYYSDKAIGTSVLGALFYEPIYWFQQMFHHPSQDTVKTILTFLVIGLPSAVAGTLMYILCLYLSKSRFRAFLITMSITLGTMYFPYSINFFSHQLTSSLIFSAFFLTFFIKEDLRIKKSWYLFLVGLLLGWAFICEFPSAVIILAVVVYYLSIVLKNKNYRHLRSFLLPVLGGAIPLILQLTYNKLCFGNFLSVGYANLNDQYYGSSMSQGLMGILWPKLSILYYMTLHPTVGIFWESPVLVLSIFGAGVMFRQRHYREEAILAICIILSYLVLISGYYMWWGGYALGPRHIIPILPYFCILLAFVPKKLNWPFVGLSLVSIGQMMIAAASTVQVPDSFIPQIGKLSFFEYSNIYSFCLKQLINGNFTQNLGQRLLHLRLWNSLTPFLLVIVGISIVFFWNEIKLLLMKPKQATE